jgi:aldose 1-epimerase
MSKINVHELQNRYWNVGILPEVGGSIAYCQARKRRDLYDVMRPTAKEDYHNPSLSSSFLMAPWSNRIRDGRFQFKGKSYQLGDLKADGTAMHGDVRNHELTIEDDDETSIILTFESIAYENVNFPFHFYTRVVYKLEDTDFVISITLDNSHISPMPAGFGLHPYFVRPDGDNTPQVKIPCTKHYELENALPTTGIPQALPERLNFQTLRTIDESEIDDVFTDRIADEPLQIYYPEWKMHVDFYADPLFQHIVFFTPKDKPFFALEPVTNTNDGFNLYNKGIENTGVFALKPGEERTATVRLRARFD